MMELVVDEERAWRWLLSLAGRGRPEPGRDGASPMPALELEGSASLAPEARRLLDLYLPLCRGCPDPFVVGHLGQSLDGRIATAGGASQWVTGKEDIVHNHRMRALFDAVVVGAGTVRHDDPQLTVRAVLGRNPVRVVLDPNRRLGANHRVFRDGETATLLICDRALTNGNEHWGVADVVGTPAEDGRLSCTGVIAALASRGLRRIFIEGGGITISRFLAAGCLHRLQITVAPLIIGSGRPGIALPEVDRLSACLRPPTRHIDLGADVMFECRFDA